MADEGSGAVPAGSLSGIQPVAGNILPEPLVDAYLQRLGLDRAAVGEPNLEALRKLQAAHIDKVHLP